MERAVKLAVSLLTDVEKEVGLPLYGQRPGGSVVQNSDRGCEFRPGSLQLLVERSIVLSLTLAELYGLYLPSSEGLFNYLYLILRIDNTLSL